MMRQKNGFILVTSIIITTLFVFLATYISYRTTIFSSFSSTTLDRQKAYMLALGGIQIGMSMLINTKEITDNKTDQSEKTIQAKALLQSILPGLNRWQTFELKSDVEGIDGQIKISISSDDGKIDLNSIYNFETHQFLGEKTSDRNWKTAMKILFSRIEQKTGDQNLFEAFEQFLQKRNQPLNDITELLQIKAFKTLGNKLFYIPSENDQKEHPLYLTDLFTLWSGKKTIQPWLFSDSVCAILELQCSKSDDIDKRRELVQQWLQDFKLDTRWAADWDNLMTPVYGKDYSSLPKNIDAIFDSKFEAHVFSILSLGTYKAIHQRLLAIVERIKTNSKGTPTFEVKIRKLYWL